MHARPRAREGFTLIELLVVIAVVALLIGILLPSLGKARRAGWTVRCQANLRSLQVAQDLYADQHRGHLVDVGLSHGGIGDASLSWTRTLESFCEGVLSLRCPADRSPFWPAEAGGQGLTLNGASRASSYGMNNHLSRTYNPGLSPREPFDRLDKIDRPSLTVQFLIMAEQGDYAVSDHPHVEGWGDAARAPSLASRQVQIDRHGGPPRAAASVSNWGFLDTHVETLPFKAVYAGRQANAFDPVVAQIAR